MRLESGLKLERTMADEKNLNPPSTDPDDEENIIIDTTSSEPLRNAEIEEPDDAEAFRDPNSTGTDRQKERERGIFTAPKFGSAGSGGAEFEPGPDRGSERS